MNSVGSPTQRPAQWHITTFYKFSKLNESGANESGQTLDQIQKNFETAAANFGIYGLMILGHEGVNVTCCSEKNEDLENFKAFVRENLKSDSIIFKDSKSENPPFRRFKVKQRDEIVTIGAPDLFPNENTDRHLTPTEWNEVLKNEKEFDLIDTRNWYETKIGTFKGAVDPKIDQFTEFPEWVEKNHPNKDKKMLIFCTGGIRCEKGILELERRGYNNVYQLEGGILKYLQEYPEDQFNGECFVFDQRVSVKQDLTPTTRYHLCPHCGQPAEKPVDCARCDATAYICDSCLEIPTVKTSCSKHCAHQLEVHPGRKGPQQIRDWKTGKTFTAQ